MNLTLNSLADLVESSEDPAMGLLKTAFLRDAPPESGIAGTLHLRSTDEITHFIGFLAVLATQANGKDCLKALKAAHTGAELALEYAQCSAANPLQSLKRAKTGEFVLDPKDNIPVFELDGKKVAPLLRTPVLAFAALKEINLVELTTSAAFVQAFSSRVSHPTKLSASAGSGGFLKAFTAEIPVGFAGVTEEDYVTRETVTLACSAGYQKMWSMLLPLFVFEETQYRPTSLMCSRPDIAKLISDTFAKNGVPQGAALVQALQQENVGKLSGEPQVFCGDLPNVQRLSVLAPYSLFNEISRARRAIQAEYEIDRDALVINLDKELLALEASAAALDAAATTKESKKANLLAKKELADKTRKVKADRKSLTSKYLSIPFFSLQFGGANPRNLAMDLDTSIHSANVLARVPAPAKVVSDIGRKAFYSNTLVAVPRITKMSGLPRYLQPGVTGSAQTMKRVNFFADLITVAMAPLMEMQLEWKTRAKELGGEVALSVSAQDKVEVSDACWSLFVKGDDSVNNKDAMALLKPLCLSIAKAVKSSLQAAFDGAVSSSFDSELDNLATAAVALERA